MFTTPLFTMPKILKQPKYLSKIKEGNVVYVYNGLLFSQEKEENPTIWMTLRTLC